MALANSDAVDEVNNPVYLAAAAGALTPPGPTSDFSWQWLGGMASGVIIFFLAWGLKDVKARYDKVPELEKQIFLLKQEVDGLRGSLQNREHRP